MDPLAKLARHVDALQTAYERAGAVAFISWKRGVTSEATLAKDHTAESDSRVKSGRHDLHVRRLGQAYDRAQRVEIARSIEIIRAEEEVEVAA